MLPRLTRRQWDGLPPGPTAHPLHQLYRFVLDPVRFHLEAAERFGPIFTLTLPGRRRVLVLGDPDPIREVFADTECFAPMNEDFIFFLNQPALIFMGGPAHRRQRRIMKPPFAGNRMATYGRTMAQVVDERVAGWTMGQPFELLEPAKEVTLDIILKCVFGVRDERGPLRQAIISWLDHCMSAVLLGASLLAGGRRVRGALNRLVARSQVRLGQPVPSTRLPGQALAHRERQIVGFLKERIRALRAHGDDDAVDIMSLLVAARYDDGQPMDEDHIINELLQLIVGGYETTATALCWISFHLARHPGVADQCRGEVLEVMGDGPLDPSRIRQLVFLNATIKEGLRLNPINIGVGRRVQRDCRLAGWDVPRGTTVQPCTYITHRRPGLWAQPEAFRPERFLEGRPTGAQYFPFGGGAKICLGKALAMYELTVVVSELLRRFDLKLPVGYTGIPQPRGITLAPEGDLPIVLRPRRSAARYATRPQPG